MELITSGTIKLSWESDSRLAIIRFERETHATGRHAEVMIGALSGWVGDDRRPFGLLGDGDNLAGVDAEYRASWGRFLRQHRENSYIAFFNMGAIIRIAADMFRIGTGLQIKAFAGEQEARAWLRENGIAA